MILVPAIELVNQGERQRHPAVAERVDLGRGVYVEQLDAAEFQAVARACSPRGLNHEPARPRGFIYALCRDSVAGEHPFVFDPAHDLVAVHQLSRLVVDHAHGLEWAARIEYEPGGIRAVRPQQFGSGLWAYRFNPDTRDWLNVGEAEQLRRLMTQFWAAEASLPARLRRALWMCEYMTHCQWLEYAIAFLVTAFESLLATSHQKVTRQFEQRVVALAAEVGYQVSGRLARRAYDLRSSAWHGEPVPLDQPPAKYARAANEAAILQRVLRAALRQAIEDPGFRDHFADDRAVRARWPVKARDGVML